MRDSTSADGKASVNFKPSNLWNTLPVSKSSKAFPLAYSNVVSRSM